MSDEAPKTEVAALDAAATVKAEKPATTLPAASDAATVKAEPEAEAIVKAAEETKTEPVKASEETNTATVKDNEETKTEAVEETKAEDVKEIKAEPVKDTAAADTTEEATAEAASDSPKDDVKEETEEDASANSIDILKTTAQESENVAKNRKFDASLLPESTDPAEMRKQVEFYFGDSNISQDKFLWENTDGSRKPMSLKIIHKFKRMQRFKSYEQLVAALRESETLAIAGEPGEETVVRKVPYDPERGNKAAPRTVYVKGFGDEEPTTQIDLEKFFNSFGLDVEAVRLRRTDKKLFKGSVYVEFKTKEDSTKFLELDPKPKWKDHDLKIMSKVDYCEEKNAQIRAGTLKPSAKRSFRAGAQSGRGRGGGKDSDKREGKDRRDNDQKRGFNNRGGRGGRGRGGRGRGRGGRGGGGGRGGHRDGDRDGQRNGAKEERKPSSCNDVKPTIHSSAPKKEANGNGKRPRDGEASGEAPAAKKVATGNA